MPTPTSASLRASSHGSGAFGVAAERLRRAGEHLAAIDLCRQGLALHPGHVGARVSLGLSLMATGRHDEAYVELKEALRLAPDNLAAIRGLAELHERGLGGEMVDPSMFDLPEMAEAEVPELPVRAVDPPVPDLAPARPGHAPDDVAIDVSDDVLDVVAHDVLDVVPDDVPGDLAAVFQPVAAAPAPAPDPAVFVPMSEIPSPLPEPDAPGIAALEVVADPPVVLLAEDFDVTSALDPLLGFPSPPAEPVAADAFAGLRLDDLDPEVPPIESGVTLNGDFSLEEVFGELDAPAGPPLDELDPVVAPSLVPSASLPDMPVAPVAAAETAAPGAHASAASTLPGLQASVFVQASIVVQGAGAGTSPSAAGVSPVPEPVPIFAATSVPAIAESAPAAQVATSVLAPSAPTTTQVAVAAAVTVQSTAVPVLSEEPAAILEEWLTRIHSRRRQILSEYAAS